MLDSIDPDTLFTAARVGRMVAPEGARPISASAVFRWYRAGKLAGVRVGRKLLFSGAAVRQFLEDGAAAANARHAAPAPTPAKRRRSHETAEAKLRERGFTG